MDVNLHKKESCAALCPFVHLKTFTSSHDTSVRHLLLYGKLRSPSTTATNNRNLSVSLPAGTSSQLSVPDLCWSISLRVFERKFFQKGRKFETLKIQCRPNKIQNFKKTSSLTSTYLYLTIKDNTV